MHVVKELETARLKLRQWQDSDYPLFAAMNADPIVMEFFPNILSNQESDTLADKIRARIEQQGWGVWAVELKRTHQFIGFVGLNRPEVDLPFNPCVEIAWRLAKEFWRNGYATEAAEAALKYAFTVLKLSEVVSFTACLNTPSQAVMQKLLMTDMTQNFDHPSVPIGHPLRPHVLYKITQQDWSRRQVK